MTEPSFRLEDYLNVELIPPQALTGEKIRGVFTPTNNSFVFIITEDNYMSVYQIENRTYQSPFSCDCENGCTEEEQGNYGVYEVLDNETLLDILLYCQDEFFFKKYNVFKNKEALEKEVERREAIQNEKFKEQEREKRFALYKELQKEFAGQENSQVKSKGHTYD